MGRRILLVGRRKSILKKLSRSLESAGFESRWVQDMSFALEHLRGESYDLVAFGRGVQPFDKKLLKDQWQKQKPELVFVDGLGPVTQLLVDQIKFAFQRTVEYPRFMLLPFEVTAQGLVMSFEARGTLQLSVDLYRLGYLYNIRRDTLTLGEVNPGRHRVVLATAVFGKKIPDFIVIKDRTEILDVRPVIITSSNRSSQDYIQGDSLRI